jgi:hypothetical protein
MTAYESAQSRLADAKRRRDSRAQHAATLESRALMHAQLRREVEMRKGAPFWRWPWRRRA